jgi:O-antigen/teichoic acid export membrane protein
MTALKLYRRLIGSDFTHKVAETFATRLMLVGIGLAMNVLIARILGPEGRGLYALAATVGALGMQFGNLGLQASNTYHVARDRELLAPLLGNSLLVSLVFGGVGALLAWIVFFVWPELAPVRGLLLVLALIWIPFGLAFMLLQNLLLGIQEVRLFNKIELASKILAVVLVGCVAVSGFISVELVFAASLAAVVASFLWTLWRLRALIKRRLSPSLALLKTNLGYGIKLYLAAFFAFLLLRMDLLMIRYLLGATETGYYSIAANMADLIYLLPTAAGSILFPKLSALTDVQAKWRLARKAALGVGLFVCPLVIVLMLLAKPLMLFMYGAAFLPSVEPFLILSVAMIFYAVNNMFASYLAAIGSPWFSVFIWVIGAIVNLALNFLSIPRWGIRGAALSSLISYALVLLLHYIYASRGAQEL